MNDFTARTEVHMDAHYLEILSPFDTMFGGGTSIKEQTFKGGC